MESANPKPTINVTYQDHFTKPEIEKQHPNQFPKKPSQIPSTCNKKNHLNIEMLLEDYLSHIRELQKKLNIYDNLFSFPYQLDPTSQHKKKSSSEVSQKTLKNSVSNKLNDHMFSNIDLIDEMSFEYFSQIENHNSSEKNQTFFFSSEEIKSLNEEKKAVQKMKEDLDKEKTLIQSEKFKVFEREKKLEKKNRKIEEQSKELKKMMTTVQERMIKLNEEFSKLEQRKEEIKNIEKTIVKQNTPRKLSINPYKNSLISPVNSKRKPSFPDIDSCFDLIEKIKEKIRSGSPPDIAFKIIEDIKGQVKENIEFTKFDSIELKTAKEILKIRLDDVNEYEVARRNELSILQARYKAELTKIKKSLEKNPDCPDFQSFERYLNERKEVEKLKEEAGLFISTIKLIQNEIVKSIDIYQTVYRELLFQNQKMQTIINKLKVYLGLNE